MTISSRDSRAFPRREFLRRGSVALAGASLASCARVAAAIPRDRPPRLLLRGSWKSVNIGDIAHTPGALRLFELYFPEAEITLWPGKFEFGARELLQKWFPRLRFAEGGLDERGQPTSKELTDAWARSDLLVHGSSSGFGARDQVEAWLRVTGRPFGALGISTDPVTGFGSGRRPEGGTLDELGAIARRLPIGQLDDAERRTYGRARFLFCRETLSRDYLRAQQVSPRPEFGPDSAFAFHLRDDARATAYLQAQGLADRRFICVIPRRRYTPYYQMAGTRATAEDRVRDEISDRGLEPDHARMRELMIAWVKNTGGKVLACPEMTYQVELAKKELIDPLPAEVKRHVVWRDHYWLPDEAASVYARAQAVISMECHSPILALVNGTPAIYLRQPTDTCKGQMFRDIGVGDWLREIDETSGAALWSVVEKVHTRPDDARRLVQGAMSRVATLQREMMQAVKLAVV